MSTAGRLQGKIAALYLASDDSAYCIGTELMVDGGLSQLVYQP